MRKQVLTSLRQVVYLIAILSLGSIALAACADGDGKRRSDDFCEAARRYQDANSMVPNPSTATPEQLEAKFTQLHAALDRMGDTAPPEIGDEISTVAATFGRFTEAFSAHHYDYPAFISDPEGRQAADALSSGDMATATGGLERYIARECATEPVAD